MVARFRYRDLKGAVCGCGRRGRYANSNGGRSGIEAWRGGAGEHGRWRSGDRVSQRNVVEAAARKNLFRSEAER